MKCCWWSVRSPQLPVLETITFLTHWNYEKCYCWHRGINSSQCIGSLGHPKALSNYRAVQLQYVKQARTSGPLGFLLVCFLVTDRAANNWYSVLWSILEGFPEGFSGDLHIGSVNEEVIQTMCKFGFLSQTPEKLRYITVGYYTDSGSVLWVKPGPLTNNNCIQLQSDMARLECNIKKIINSTFHSTISLKKIKNIDNTQCWQGWKKLAFLFIVVGM